jgi:hypothetical protein
MNWTITPENVRAPLGAPRLTKLAAQNIGPGNWLWEPNANYYDLANGANINASRATAFSVDFAYTGQPLTAVAAGTVTLGNSALANAHPLYLNNTPGAACNFADIPAGGYVTKLGYANNASTAVISIEATGIVKG